MPNNNKSTYIYTLINLILILKSTKKYCDIYSMFYLLISMYKCIYFSHIWIGCSIFLRSLGASSYPVSSACETSCGDSGTTDSESTTTCAGTGGEAIPGGIASTGINC